MTATTPLDRALQAYKQQHYPEAVKQLSGIAAIHPEDAQVWMWLGAACREASQVDDAKSYFQQALRLANNPKVAEHASASLAQLEYSPVGVIQHDSVAKVGGSQPAFKPTLPRSVIEAGHRENVGGPLEGPLDQNASKSSGLLRGLSLGTKTTITAIALGTLPLLVIGTTAYSVANREATQQVEQARENDVTNLVSVVSQFMNQRYAEIQVMADTSIFSDPTLRVSTPLQQKQARLDNFAKAFKVYDSIAVFDLQGNLIAQSKGTPLKNHSDRDYFQSAVKTRGTVFDQPGLSKTTGKFVIHFATPVRETGTGKIIAVARTTVTLDALKENLKNFVAAGSDYYLSDSSGKFFLSTQENEQGKEALAVFPGLAQLRTAGKTDSQVIKDQVKNSQELVTYAPFKQQEGLDLGWSAVLTSGSATAFSGQRQLLLTILLGTGVTALVVAAISALLARRVVRPIMDTTNAVQKLGQGDFNTRVPVQGDDELAILGLNINSMADQIQNLLVEQEESTRQQLATQAEVTRQQAENAAQQAQNAEQQRLEKERLQTRALELLMEVDPVSRGDLTIRAKVTEDEIGTVADSYNATIGSLRQIVAQVQAAARQMAETTSQSEVSVQGLSVEALRQSEEITVALDQLQEMSNSIRAVAARAEQAEAAVQQATQTVSEGDAAMNRTVEGILAIRETVAETSKKVKRLGESSEEISKVVNLISNFADQTNLLALNASIEAARAGEEGRGFGVVADEVRALALQSAEATADIARIVTDIQAGTNEVITAMEAGNQQVVMGTKLVDETRQNLNKITAVSVQISDLVAAIGQAAVDQSQASESVTHTMTDVAAISNKTSTDANQVSASFKNLLSVAQELQASAGQFKVS